MYSSAKPVEKGDRGTILLGLMPVMLPYLLIFTLGIGFAILQSFGYLLPPPVKPQGFTAYFLLLKDPWFLRSFVHSLTVSCMATSISVALGTLLALFLWRLSPGARVLASVYKIPLILPHLVVAFLVLILFDPSGLFSSLSLRLGLTSSQADFPNLLYAPWGGGLIVAYIIKETPFVAMMVYAVLTGIDERMMQTARMLGCRGPELFFALVLPEIAYPLHTVFIILFLYSFGGVDIPMVLGSSRPQMISLFIYNDYFQRDLSRRPVAMAALSLALLFSLLFIVGYTYLVRRGRVTVRKV